jgi:hypothetical protein
MYLYVKVDMKMLDPILQMSFVCILKELGKFSANFGYGFIYIMYLSRSIFFLLEYM